MQVLPRGGREARRPHRGVVLLVSLTEAEEASTEETGQRVESLRPLDNDEVWNGRQALREPSVPESKNPVLSMTLGDDCPMTTYDVLKSAILQRRCVSLVAQRWKRDVCPHALGRKGEHLVLLAFQYGVGSTSGLSKRGGWRTFFIDEIVCAKIVDGDWRTLNDYLAKLETTLDHVECRVPAARQGMR